MSKNSYRHFSLFLFIAFATITNSVAQWVVYDFNGAGTGTGYNIDQPTSIKVAPSQGGIWIGTQQSGVFNFDGVSSGSFVEYSYNISTPGFPNDYIKNIDVHGNQIIAGTGFGGAAKFVDPTWTSVSTSDGLADNEVWGTQYDSGGDLWYATYSGLSKQNNTVWQTYNTGNSTGMPTNHLYAIYVDVNDTKWLGTNGYGLLKFTTTWQVYTTGNSSIPSNNINKIAATPDGSKLWICTDNGIALFDRNSNWTVYNSSNTTAITDNNIEDIAVDNLGNIFLATPAGLVVRWANGTWKSWNTGNSQLPENSLTCVAWNSSNGDVWMGTNSKGIVKVAQTVLAVEKSVLDQSLFAAYPNPFSDELTVTLGLKYPAENITISIADIYGKEVFKDKDVKSASVNFEKHISTSALSAGVYLLKVEVEGETVTKKIIKY